MAALTLAAVDAAIAALVANQQVDFQVGELSVSYSQKLEGLLKIRAELIANPEASISTIEFADDVGRFGQRI